MNQSIHQKMIGCSDELMGKKEFFKKVYDYLDDQNVIRTCFEYFKSLEGLATFNNLPIPQTAYQTELKKLSIGPPEQFLIHLCYLYEKLDIVDIPDKEFFKLFQEFLIDNNIDYDTTPLKLGVKLANLKTGAISKGIHSAKGHAKKYNLKLLRTKYNVDDDIFIDDEEPESKPVIINQITNYDHCTIQNVNETKTAKVKTTKFKHKLDSGIFTCLDDE